MDIEDIRQRAKGIIVTELDIEESSVTPQANLMNDLGADSLDTLKLAQRFEMEFDISIATQDIVEIQTFDDVVNKLSAKLK